MNDGVLGLATGVTPRGVLPSPFLSGLSAGQVAVRMETTVAAKPRERLDGINGHWIRLFHGPQAPTRIMPHSESDVQGRPADRHADPVEPTCQQQHGTTVQVDGGHALV
jgi:hypothetical protein